MFKFITLTNGKITGAFYEADENQIEKIAGSKFDFKTLEDGTIVQKIAFVDENGDKIEIFKVPFKSDLDTWHKGINDNTFEESIENLPAKFLLRVGDFGTDDLITFSGSEITNITELIIKYSNGAWATITETVASGTTITGLWEVSGTDLVIGNDGTNYFTGQIASVLGYNSGSTLIFESVLTGQGDYEYDLVNNNHGTWSGTGDRYTYDLEGSTYAAQNGYSLWEHATEPSIQVPFDVNGDALILTPGTDIPTGYTKTRDVAGGSNWNMADVLVDMEAEAPVLQCNTTGIAYVDSNAAYGLILDCVIKKQNASHSVVAFIIDDLLAVGATDGYNLVLKTDESIQLRRKTNELFITEIDYVNSNQNYRILIWRNSVINEFITGGIGTFAAYIQGKTYVITSTNYLMPNLADMELIDVSGGSGANPVTDNMYTTSNYYYADFRLNDQISKIKINNKYISPYEFTVDSGAYSIIDNPANEIFNRLNTTRQTAISRASDHYDAAHPYQYHINEIADPRIYDTFFEAAFKDKIFGKVTLDGDDIIGWSEELNYGDQKVGDELLTVEEYCGIDSIYP